MNKFMKIMAPTLALAMLAPSTAMAADFEFAPESTIYTITIDGEYLWANDTPPIVEGGTAYLPLRSMLSHYGVTEISYLADTKEIMFMMNDSEIKFNAGSQLATITKNEEVSTINVGSMLVEGITYVDAAFIAEITDSLYGLDDSYSSVNFAREDLFTIPEGTTFEMANMYNNYSYNLLGDGKYEIDGLIDLAVETPAYDTDAPITIGGSMVIDGIASNETINMGLNLNLDLTDIKNYAMDYAYDADEIQEIEDVFGALSSMEFDVIFNVENLIYYIKSNIFELADMSGEAWYSLDMSPLLETIGLDFTGLMQMQSSLSFEEQVELLLPEPDLTNTIALASTISSYEMINELFADSAFAEVDGGYMSSYVSEEYGVETTTSLFIAMEEEVVTGYSMEFLATMYDEEYLTGIIAQDGLETIIDFDMNMDGLMSFSMEGSINYEETNRSPLTEPATGDVIDLTSILTGIY